MNFPPLKNVDFAPFLNVVTQVKGHLTEAISEVTDPELRDMFSGILKEMESTQVKLEVEAPQWKARMQANYAKVIDAFGVATIKKDALLAQLKTLEADIDVKIASARALAVEVAKRPKRVMPRPRPLNAGKTTPALHLSSGGTLRALLMARTVIHSSTPHVSGNIWENWPSK